MSGGNFDRSTCITISGRYGPNASSAAISTVLNSPTFMPSIAPSKPGITRPSPTVNSNGSPSKELSNIVPSVNRPV